MSTRRPRLIDAATAYRSLTADAAEVIGEAGDDGANLSNRWAGPITLEGEVTGDGRMLARDSLYWPEELSEENPLPFRTVREDVGAHDNAVTSGHIFTIERLTVDQANERLAALGRPLLSAPSGVRVIWGTGDFDFGSDEGVEGARLVRERLQTGVSVDLDDVAFEVRVASELIAEDDEEPALIIAAAGDDPEENGRDYEVVFEAKPDDEIMVTTSARIRSATQVAIPAFAYALIGMLAEGENGGAPVIDDEDDDGDTIERGEDSLAAAADEAAEPATGAIVALLPAASDPIVAASSQIAHVTMAYLGDAADLDEATIDAIRLQVAELAAASAPTTAVPESRGELGEAPADVVFVRGDGVDELRELLAAEGTAVAPAIAADAFDWNPHITLGYPDEPPLADYDPDEHDEVAFDRLALWLGEERTDYPLGEAVPEALLAAAAPLDPPREWFADPKLSGPTPIRIDDEGRIYGHLATWDVCHIASPAGEGVCVVAPHSAMGYARFHTGTTRTASGEIIDTGKITMGTGHAGPRSSGAAAAAHYDNTGAAVADVRAGEDSYGIWVAGALRPSVTPEQIRTLRASPLSGDWRRDESTRGLELRAALAVNVPGFPIPRPTGLVASGELTSLVASGVVIADEAVEAVTAPGSTLSASDAAYLSRLIEREKLAEAKALAARVAESKLTINRRKVAAFVAARR